MSIKPIDFQISIPKSFEASKLQQENLKRNDLEIQNDMSAIKMESEKKSKSVNTPEKTDKQNISDDAKQKGQEFSKKKSKKKKAASEEETSKIDYSSGFDIKI